MMQRCLSQRKRCSSLTTHFHVAGDADPEYNVTITYPTTTPESQRSVLFSFQLSTDQLVLNAIPCFIQNHVLMSHRTFGPINFSEVVLQADVIVDARGQLGIRNSRLSFSDSMSYPVRYENGDYNTIVRQIMVFIEEQC
uniref:BPI2 domain-containing protein n=1 Tax=Mesocestoides corti TaxID=53468 RepID=A0A5K3F249_MESCO